MQATRKQSKELLQADIFPQVQASTFSY